MQRICERVANYSDAEVDTLLAEIRAGFKGRHRNLDRAFNQHYTRAVEVMHTADPHFAGNRRLLFGACLTMEYAIQGAALFNPSIVPHPNQSGVNEGEVRFIMSLRATGEGHISSIVFRTGTVDQSGQINLDSAGSFATAIQRDGQPGLPKAFVAKQLAATKYGNVTLLDALPTVIQLSDVKALRGTEAENLDHFQANYQSLLEILDLNYDLIADSETELSERVIFPLAKNEHTGMEDLRLVRFSDGETQHYYGTYTAYDGLTIRTQLLSTADFRHVQIRTLNGPAIKDKGMALFPEKIGGRYAMIGRQGGESISIMFSDDLHVWTDSQPLLEPEYPWEVVQMGNCGSPIRTDKGWLLLTHGVGPMRRYVLGLVLLNLHDPTIVLARSQKPLVEPLETEREGYVPNVLYTCGWLDMGDLVVISYAMSDSACGIITAPKRELLDELLTGTTV